MPLIVTFPSIISSMQVPLTCLYVTETTIVKSEAELLLIIIITNAEC